MHKLSRRADFVTDFDMYELILESGVLAEN